MSLFCMSHELARVPPNGGLEVRALQNDKVHVLLRLW